VLFGGIFYDVIVFISHVFHELYGNARHKTIICVYGQIVRPLFKTLREADGCHDEKQESQGYGYS
jgi:hypothetical protein